MLRSVPPCPGRREYIFFALRGGKAKLARQGEEGRETNIRGEVVRGGIFYL